MQTRNLTITPNHDGLVLAGRFDAHEVDEVARLLDQVAPTSTVDVDLTGVDFLDGAALQLLESRHQALALAGGRLRISAASTAAALVLDFAERAGIVSHLADAARDVTAGLRVDAVADLAVAA